MTGRDGRVSQLDQVYIRGSMIRFFIVPDMLQNAPMCGIHLLSVCGRLADRRFFWTRFKRVGPNAMKGRGIGTARGRATIMRGEVYKRLVFLASKLMTFLQQMVRGH